MGWGSVAEDTHKLEAPSLVLCGWERTHDICSRHFYSEFTALLKTSPHLLHRVTQSLMHVSVTHTGVLPHSRGDVKLLVLDETICS